MDYGERERIHFGTQLGIAIKAWRKAAPPGIKRYQGARKGNMYGRADREYFCELVGLPEGSGEKSLDTWLKGEVMPDATNRENICAVLGVKPSYFALPDEKLSRPIEEQLQILQAAAADMGLDDHVLALFTQDREARNAAPFHPKARAEIMPTNYPFIPAGTLDGSPYVISDDAGHRVLVTIEDLQMVRGMQDDLLQHARLLALGARQKAKENTARDTCKTWADRVPGFDDAEAYRRISARDWTDGAPSGGIVRPDSGTGRAQRIFNTYLSGLPAAEGPANPLVLADLWRMLDAVLAKEYDRLVWERDSGAQVIGKGNESPNLYHAAAVMSQTEMLRKGYGVQLLRQIIAGLPAEQQKLYGPAAASMRDETINRHAVHEWQRITGTLPESTIYRVADLIAALKPTRDFFSAVKTNIIEPMAAAQSAINKVTYPLEIIEAALSPMQKVQDSIYAALQPTAEWRAQCDAITAGMKASIDALQHVMEQEQARNEIIDHACAALEQEAE